MGANLNHPWRFPLDLTLVIDERVAARASIEVPLSSIGLSACVHACVQGLVVGTIQARQHLSYNLSSKWRCCSSQKTLRSLEYNIKWTNKRHHCKFSNLRRLQIQKIYYDLSYNLRRVYANHKATEMRHPLGWQLVYLPLFRTDGQAFTNSSNLLLSVRDGAQSAVELKGLDICQVSIAQHAKKLSVAICC
jgi:hypothetical protein